MKIVLAQLNPRVGDFKGNLEKLEKAVSFAKGQGADLVVFSELFLSGFPPKDLLSKKDFIKASLKATQKVLKISLKYPSCGILFGNLFSKKGKIYNSAILVSEGKIIFVQPKTYLFESDPFLELKYLEKSKEIKFVSFKKEKLGVLISLNFLDKLEKLQKKEIFSLLKNFAQKKVTLLFDISASPFWAKKEKIKFSFLKKLAQKFEVPFISLNQVGGVDELIFEGESMIFNKKGKLVKILPSFEEKLEVVETSKFNQILKFEPQEEISSIYKALILGIRDYFKKTGFKKAVLGLSGGIDSSLTCVLAVKALGAKNVLGLSLPSLYSSEASIKDAKALAKNLGIQFKVIPITPIYKAYLEVLKDALKISKKITVVEENLQARIRANILMAFSNKFKSLVLSCGNKSELAIGYTTLYGDLTGGLAPLSDLPKTKVYELARYINREKEIIPSQIFKKPPSPELRPNQLTEKDLIPFKILDPLIELYLEKNLSFKEILKKGFSPQKIKWLIKKIHQSEFKRRQGPLGLKITTKPFDLEKKFPLTGKYEF